VKSSLKIVSSYGVLGEIFADHVFSVTAPFWDETFPSYATFSKKYGISPVCIIERNEIHGVDIFQFANVNGLENISSTLDKEIELGNLAINLARYILPESFRVRFYFGALRHSLCSIVKEYMELATRFSKSLAIPGWDQPGEKDFLLSTTKLPIGWIRGLPASRVDICALSEGYADAIFYEMMAYLTCARSLLDSLVHVLKTRVSIRKSGYQPRERSYQSFMNSIGKCPMPTNLVDFLTKNWAWVSKLIEYRDCLIHKEILCHSSLPYIMGIHTENRVIALLAWLPDNPEVHSTKSFRFDDHIEYLTYAHMTYVKLLDFCLYVLNDTLKEAIGNQT
jgi:hypothetical protein